MNVGGHALFQKTSAMASMAISYLGGSVTQSFNASNRLNTSQTMQQSKAQTNNYNSEKLKGSSGKSQ
jgi:hypothetical protein